MDETTAVLSNTEKKKKKGIKLPNWMKKFFDFFVNDKYFISRHKYVLLGFLIPFLFMFVCFAINGVSPFGDKQILVTDFWHQYYPFMVDYQAKLQEGGSLLWTWTVGGGTNFIALMSYYLCSPLYLLFVLIPKTWLREYLFFSTCIKIGFAGGFFSYFLKKTFKRNDISITVFGSLYALCSFIMGYYWCVMWLDSIALLPLVVCGEIALLKDYRHFKLFTISLGLAIISNYYIGLFVCVFVVFVAIAYTLIKWTNLISAIKNLAKMIIFSLAGGALSAIITLPAYLALGRAHSASSTFPSNFAINIGGSNDVKGVLTAFDKVFSQTLAFIDPTTKEGLPNVYCGIIALVLGLLFFTCGKIKIRERIFCGVLNLFFIYSFIDRRLDYMWHGFHFPNMLPYRFSFLFSFVLIYMAFRVFQNIESIKLYQVLIATGLYMIIIGISIKNNEKLSLYGSAFIGLLLIIWLIIYVLKVVPKNALVGALTIIMLAEGACTAFIGVKTVSVTTKSSYPLSYDAVEKNLDTIKEKEKNNIDLYREELTKYHTLDDVALYGMTGYSMFNSLTTESVSKFTEKIGICSWPGSNRYTYQDSSPYTNMLLNIKYVIAPNGNFLDTTHNSLVDQVKDVKSFENNYYVPMGFMMNDDVLNYSVEAASSNPFDVQNEIYKWSTGDEKNMYEQLEVVHQGHTDYDHFHVDKSSYGHYSFSKQEGCEDTPHLKYNYEAPRDGDAYIYFSASGCDNCTVKINNEDLTTYYCKRPWIMNVGDVKKGDLISVYSTIDKDTSNGNVEVYCNMINEDSLENAYKYYSKNTLHMTKLSDTEIIGNINTDMDGLFYTSIAYDPGWKVTIDGKETELSTLSDGQISFKLTKGDHFIKMTYCPEGFKIGATLTIGSILFITLLSIILYLIKKKKSTKI